AAVEQDRGVLADPVDERFRMLLGDAVKPAPALIPGQHWFNRGAANNTEPGNEIGVVTAEREDTLILVVAIGWIGVRNGPVAHEGSHRAVSQRDGRTTEYLQNEIVQSCGKILRDQRLIAADKDHSRGVRAPPIRGAEDVGAGGCVVVDDDAGRAAGALPADLAQLVRILLSDVLAHRWISDSGHDDRDVGSLLPVGSGDELLDYATGPVDA